MIDLIILVVSVFVIQIIIISLSRKAASRRPDPVLVELRKQTKLLEEIKYRMK